MGTTPKRTIDRGRQCPPTLRPIPTCERCGAVVVDVDLVVDDVRLNMQACSVCDVRRWRRDGEVQEFGDVLADIDATSTRYRRDYASR